MQGRSDKMHALFGVNVSEFNGEVMINNEDGSGHCERALIRDKGFDNDWHKVYFQ